MFNCSTNVSTVLIKFNNIFYASIFNNFCFFEHANELIHVQISGFIHKIYDDSESNLKAAISSWAILYQKSSETPDKNLENKSNEVYFQYSCRLKAKSLTQIELIYSYFSIISTIFMVVTSLIFKF